MPKKTYNFSAADEEFLCSIGIDPRPVGEDGGLKDVRNSVDLVSGDMPYENFQRINEPITKAFLDMKDIPSDFPDGPDEMWFTGYGDEPEDVSWMPEPPARFRTNEGIEIEVQGSYQRDFPVMNCDEHPALYSEVSKDLCLNGAIPFQHKLMLYANLIRSREIQGKTTNDKFAGHMLMMIRDTSKDLPPRVERAITSEIRNMPYYDGIVKSVDAERLLQQLAPDFYDEYLRFRKQ